MYRHLQLSALPADNMLCISRLRLVPETAAAAVFFSTFYLCHKVVVAFNKSSCPDRSLAENLYSINLDSVNGVFGSSDS